MRLNSSPRHGPRLVLATAARSHRVHGAREPSAAVTAGHRGRLGAVIVVARAAAAASSVVTAVRELGDLKSLAPGLASDSARVDTATTGQQRDVKVNTWRSKGSRKERSCPDGFSLIPSDPLGLINTWVACDLRPSPTFHGGGWMRTILTRTMLMRTACPSSTMRHASLSYGES